MKLSTGKVRISYANIWHPRSYNGQDPKYSVSLLIPKSDKKTLDKLKSIFKEMQLDPENVQKWGGKVKGIRIPLRDGDEEREDDAAYKGCYFINASATPDYPPRVVDKDKQEIIDPSEVYSGCYCQAVINLYAYNRSGNRGIGVGLLGLRKLADGEPLSGGVATDNDFDDDSGSDKDDDLY